MKSIIIWGESSAEIEDFLKLINNDYTFQIKKAFVAKRGVGNNYLHGIYYPYDLNLKACVNKEVQAPNFITKLVQWCSPDLIMATEEKPVLSIETTYHNLTYNNIAQRIPRQVKSSTESIPNVIFQKISDYDVKNIEIWYCKTFLQAKRIYNVPSLALLFTESDFETKRKQLVDLCNSITNESSVEINKITNEIESSMNKYAIKYDQNTVLYTKRGKLRNWIRIYEDRVIVIIGVNPEGTGWKTKGTGLMDPYPGLVKMSELLFCFDDSGKRKKKLITYFANLPRDFWWFKKFPNEIYYSIIKEFSDEVYYKGELII